MKGFQRMKDQIIMRLVHRLIDLIINLVQNQDPKEVNNKAKRRN